MKSLESLYKKVIEKPLFRQEFVNSLDLGEVKQYIYEVSVKEDDEIISENGIRTDPVMRCIYLEEIPLSRIEIFPVAFEERLHKNVYDFLSTLIFHEGFHAYENYHHPIYYQRDLYLLNEISKVNAKNICAEIRAEENTLKNLTSKNSIFYLGQTMDMLKHHKEELEKIFNKI